MKTKILIVDDEIDLLDILNYHLIKTGYDVETATSGEEAIEKVEQSTSPYSLILLDVMMRGINGFETAQQLKAKGYDMPIIFLTALDNEADLLKGFSVGADDYIAKPFSVKEVLARVKAVVARLPQSEQEQIVIGDLVIHTPLKEVSIKGENIVLTRTEYNLLLFLAQHRGRIFSREELFDNVWDEGAFVEVRTIDVHIARLRRKLSAAGEIILNRTGYGYYINKNL